MEKILCFLMILGKTGVVSIWLPVAQGVKRRNPGRQKLECLHLDTCLQALQHFLMEVLRRPINVRG